MAPPTAVSHLRRTLRALKELRVDVKLRVLLHVDDQPGSVLLQKDQVNSRAKHLTVRYHLVREHAGIGYDVVDVPSEDN